MHISTRWLNEGFHLILLEPVGGTHGVPVLLVTSQRADLRRQGFAVPSFVEGSKGRTNGIKEMNFSLWLELKKKQVKDFFFFAVKGLKILNEFKRLFKAPPPTCRSLS